MYKTKKRIKWIPIIIVSIIFLLLLGVGTFFYMIGPVSSNKDIVEFEVTQGQTYATLGSELKKENLIKSEFFYKIYIKLFSPTKLEKGTYELNKSLNIPKIIKKLESGSTINKELVYITIPEGKHITDIAEVVAKMSGKEASEYLNYWNSDEFINKVIEKYWFVTDTVKNENIRYALEGYFFPSTYELLNKDVSAEYIGYKLLDQMEAVLNKYKTDIEASEYTIHELLTMASIVEHEAILDEDRPIIASVFYNRLNDGIKLQSCATVGYAINEWKLTYTASDLKTDSLYNTYYYAGLPVGPGNSPSEKSIKAAIYPSETDYYYFMADICTENPKTYFAKTYKEHSSNVRKYLTCQ